MKLKIIFIALAGLLISTATFFWLEGCRKPVGAIEPKHTNSQVLLNSRVIDAHTKEAIPGAEVIVGSMAYQTDNEGKFSFYVDYSMTYPIEIFASAENYVFSSTVLTSPTHTTVINLLPLNEGVTIDNAGGEIVSISNESVSGSKIKLIIPEGVLNNEVKIYVTPLEGIFVPGFPPKSIDSMLNLTSVSLEPKGQTFSENVMLYLPLPFYTDAGTELDLYLYNYDTKKWETTNKVLVVDDTRSGGFVEISHFSNYSILGKGSYIEQIGEQQSITDIQCTNDTAISWMADVIYPEGIPEGVSERWLKNTVSQNTLLGGKVSFFDSTTTSIPCDIPVPNTDDPPPSIEIVIPPIIVCPEGQSAILIDDGIVWEKRIIDESVKMEYIRNGAVYVERVRNRVTVLVPVHYYHWECIHDQGEIK